MSYSRRKLLKYIAPVALFAGFSSTKAATQSAKSSDSLSQDSAEKINPKRNKGVWGTIKGHFRRNDGFKLIGQCQSIAELRAVVPEFDGQSVMVSGYYESHQFKKILIYDWDDECEDIDDSGITICSDTLEKGRFKLRVNNLGGVYDCSIWGMLPSHEYSENQMDINLMLERAIAAIGMNGVLHFSLPVGWMSAHYLNNKIGQDFSGVWLSTDDGVVIHSPFVPDNEGSKPRLKTNVVFSEVAPGSDYDYATKRGRNDYNFLDSTSAVFASSVTRLSDQRFSLPLLDGSRCVTFSEKKFKVIPDASGMYVDKTTARWEDPSVSGDDYSGLEFASASGTEISIIVQKVNNKGGKIVIGARIMGDYKLPESYLLFRLSVGSREIEVLRDEKVIHTYKVTHPADFISSSVGVINIGMRVTDGAKGIHLVLNGKPFPVVATVKPVKSLLLGANESARKTMEMRFAQLREREFLSYSKPLKIAVLGDSISRGARTSNEWPRLLEGIAEHMPGLGSMSITNHAVSGIRLHVVAGMIDKYDFNEFDYVLVMLGTNDCQMKGAEWVGYYAKDMFKVIDKIIADGAEPILGVFPRYTSKEMSGGGIGTANAGDVGVYQHFIREFCIQKNIAVAEVDEALGDNYGSPKAYESNKNRISNAWTSDNIHPNSRGQLAIASAFAAALSRAATHPSKPSLS